MSTNWAVLPVTLKDTARETGLTKAWLELVMGYVAAYWRDMSGGRETIGWRVFDWTTLDYTLAQKSTWTQPEIADKARDAVAAKWRADLSKERYIVILDDGVSRGGVTNPHPIVGAIDATPALICHEMGHHYAAGESQLATPSGRELYGDPVCIMGLEGGKYSYVESTLNGQIGLQSPSGTSGPGMCAGYLSAAGWFNLADPTLALPVPAVAANPLGPIGALSGSPYPGTVGPPRCAVVTGATANPDERLVISYRIPTGWDRQLPGGPDGWIVAELVAGSGKGTTSLLVGAGPARVGETFTIRMTGLRLSVVGLDPARRLLSFRFEERRLGHGGFLGQFDNGNPGFVQGRFGTHGNFEVVAPMAAGGIGHWWRDNDDAAMPWHGPSVFGRPQGSGLVPVDAVSLIRSRFGSPGHLEVVARVGGHLEHWWRESAPPWTWHGPKTFGDGNVAGNPVLIHGTFGTRGNFEVVVPLADGGVAHYWRNNDDPEQPWLGPFGIPVSLPPVQAVGLIQSTYGDPGFLELVVRAGRNLYHLRRGPSGWSGRTRIGDSVFTGNPAIIQLRRQRTLLERPRIGQEPTTHPDFLVVCPVDAGGLVMYRSDNGRTPRWRTHDQIVGPGSWNRVYFGQVTPSPARFFMDAVGFIEGNYGNPGNLEVIARCDDRLAHCWRGADMVWRGPFLVG